MTDHVVRLYALAGAILVFFLSWAAIAARPWVDQPAAEAVVPFRPELAALHAREQALRKRIAAAQKAFGAFGADALPSVRVVSTPPATVTRSS